MRPRPIFHIQLSVLQQDDSHVIYIRAGGSSADQAIHLFQGVIGVVVRQDLVDGQAGLGQLALGLAVHDAAGGVGGPSVPSEPREKIRAFSIPEIPSAADRASS